MPGIDFQILRSEITMKQVLDQLRFAPTGRPADRALSCMALAPSIVRRRGADRSP